jgi:hypothetical protein
LDVLLVSAVIVLLIAVAAFVARPLLRPDTEIKGDAAEAELADLEARKQTKYREIRDAEMDFRSGKLSEADYKLLDGELRSEAIEILQAIDRVDPQGPRP